MTITNDDIRDIIPTHKVQEGDTPLLFRPLGVKHLSPSQLDLFLKCPGAWHRRYVQRLPERGSGNLITGLAAHHAVAHYFRYLWKAKKRMAEGQLLTSFSDDFDARVRKEAEIDWGTTSDKKKEPLDEGRTKDRGVVALRAFHGKLLPELAPTNVEAKVSRAIPGTDIDLVGRIDLVEERAIRDHKFTGRMKGEDDVNRDLQLSAYAWMAGWPRGADARGWEVSLEVATFGGTAKRLASWRGPAHVEFYEEHILGRVVAALHHCLQTGSFPCQPTDWHCSEKWCSFWQDCIGKTWKGE
jgi:hypothetical protein